MPREVVARQDPEAVRRVLASVPGWFEIPEADASYAADAVRLLEHGPVAMNELQRIDWNGPTLILVKPR
jgi:hypothetical protein